MSPFDVICMFDFECKRRTPLRPMELLPTSVIEGGFVLWSLSKKTELESFGLSLCSEGLYAPGVAKWLSQDPASATYYAQRIEENKNIDNFAAMANLHDWVKQARKVWPKVHMVAYPAVFDWQFLNTYCLSYLGSNPFWGPNNDDAYTATDLDSYARGKLGRAWDAGLEDEWTKKIAEKNPQFRQHNALDDCRRQCRLMQKIHDYPSW